MATEKVSGEAHEMGRYSGGLDNGSLHSRSSSASSSRGTLYERKCAIVNKEIDAMGMGKYQWSIWWLCGFGYLLDLLWAQAFGLVVSPLKQELGFGSAFLTLLSAPEYVLTCMQAIRAAISTQVSTLASQQVRTQYLCTRLIRIA